MRRHALPALVLLLFIAGCFQPTSPTTATGAAPAWAVGDWWTYHLSAPLYGREANVTLVVGAMNETSYLLGMPEDDYALDAILYHVPPAGAMARADLSWSVHDATFAPFRFPLSEGASWETTWAVTPVKLTARAETVKSLTGDTPGFRITNELGTTNRKFEYTYAEAGAHWFVTYERSFADGRVLERMDLIEHGHGYKGTVRLLDGITIVLLESRTTGALKGATPAPPTVAFRSPEGVDTLMIACVAGGSPGTYRAEVPGACDASLTLAPGETRFLAKPTEARGVKPGTTFEARLGAGGQGSATVEAIGYRSWTVDL